jgi:hypothetical protein
MVRVLYDLCHETPREERNEDATYRGYVCANIALLAALIGIERIHLGCRFDLDFPPFRIASIHQLLLLSSRCAQLTSKEDGDRAIEPTSPGRG